MRLKPWKKIRTLSEINNPWWSYRKDLVRLPSGKNGEYHFVHVNGSCMVIPVLDDKRIVLVNQYRYLLSRESIEFPCGSVKDGSTYEETARHELAEETNFEAEDFEYIAEFNPYNGITDEMCKIYIARKLSPVDAVPDETEEFEIILLTPKEFDKKIRSHQIWDGMTMAAWAIVKPILLK